MFWARCIFGLRTIRGPVSGALGIEWKRFLIFNSLGACTWVTTISLSGYLFASEFNSLLDYFEKGSWAISFGLLVMGFILWRREKKLYHERQGQARER